MSACTPFPQMSNPAPEAELTVMAYGVHVTLRARDGRTLERMTRRLPPTWSATSSRKRDRSYTIDRRLDPSSGALGSCLLIDEEKLVRRRDLDRLLDVFASDVQLYVAEMAPDRVFVHAGALGWKGRAIIVPGRSWSGKTTLVAELVRAGATYYSDEYAVLDEGGYVHPYPRLLSLRREDERKPLRLSAEALGGTTGQRPLPVGLVVLSEYRPGARWQPERLSAGRGVLALIANTVSIRRQPAAALAALQRVVTGASVLKGERGDAGALAISLLEGAFADR